LIGDVSEKARRIDIALKSLKMVEDKVGKLIN
jgi:hypothetical protein